MDRTSTLKQLNQTGLSSEDADSIDEAPKLDVKARGSALSRLGFLNPWSFIHSENDIRHPFSGWNTRSRTPFFQDKPFFKRSAAPGEGLRPRACPHETGSRPNGPYGSHGPMGPKDSMDSMESSDFLGPKALNAICSGFSPSSPWSPWPFAKAILHAAHAIFLG
jgi:hypothetical protein